MSVDHLLLVDEAAPGIRVLTLDRPDKCNALSTALLAAVAARCRAAAVDTSVRCVVIAAAGPAFCAGADIAEMRDGGPHAVGERERQRQWAVIEQFPKPFIAAVEGPAFGGGNELAMLADIVVAGPNARFGQPEVGIGGMPGDGGTQRLVRAVGKGLAMQMILTGKPIDASTALHSGLVSECVQAGSALARAMEIAGGDSGRCAAGRDGR